MAEPEKTMYADAPVGLFRALYSIIAWACTLVVMASTVWLLWTLFVHTPAGTTRSQSLAVLRPTVAALAAAVPTAKADSGANCTSPNLPVACAACHTIDNTSAAGKVCPNLTHIGTEAAKWIADATYTGKAKTAADYIRESILEPSVFIVPGATYRTAAGSVMPAAIGAALPPADLDALVACLAVQK